jgi:hypothetical protein
MIELVPYRAEHVAAIVPTPDAEAFKAFTTPAVARSLEGPFAKTALLDGRPIACAGLANRWYESWITWAYLSRDTAKYMLPITRAIRKALPDLPKGRIEAATPMDYAAGRRWLEMLGFTCETPNGMRHYTPDGRSFALYSLVNK